jgi:hypothetical protein
VIVGSGFGLQATIEDRYGNAEASDNAVVPVALASNPGGATLGGTLSVTASSGVATFSGLTMDQLGSGYSLAVASDGLTGTTTEPFDVIPVPATTFVVTTEPSDSLLAGAPFGLIVQAEDDSGDFASTFDGTVTVALATGPAGATLGGTLTVTASNGVASFSGLTLTTAASGYTLQVSSNGLAAVNTTAISVTPAAASKVVIAEQPPASITAGNPFGLGALIEDPYGNVETADNGAVTLSLASSPVGAVLGGTLAVAASQGVAAFSGLTLTTAASGYTLQVSRGGLIGAVSSAVTVTPAAPAKLVPATAPGSVTAGVALGLSVDVEDPYGNLSAPVGSISIAIASGPAGGTLGGQTTASASGGAATFSSLILNRAGSYRLQASGGGLPPVTIGPIVVMPAAPTRLLVTTPAPSTVTAGISFGLSVSAADAYGNPTPSFGGDATITASGASGGGTLGGTTTVSPNGGLAVFSGLLLDTVGTYTLQVSSVSLGAIAAGTIAVTPAQASQLILMSQPPTAITAGAAFGVRVEAEDAYGNLATGFNGLLTAALMPNVSNAMLAGSVTVIASQGVAAFAGLSVDRAGSGDTIQVTGNGLAGVTSGAFDVTPAAAAQLVIMAQPPATVNAGDPFGFSVAAVDPYGNAVTSYNGRVTIALGKDPGHDVLNGTAAATMNSGIAGFSDLSLDSAASGYTITATSSGLSAATTTAIAVVPTSPAKLVVTIPPPTSLTAGAGFGLAIAAEDSYGNLTANLTGVVTLALANDPTGATLVGPLTTTATGGVANFPAALTLDTAGTGYTIQASAAGLAPVTTAPITVIAAPATQLVVLIQPPSSASSGSAFGVVFAAEDAYGNVDPNFNGRVTVAPASGSGATLAGTTTVMASQGLASFARLTLSGASSPVSLQVNGAGLTGTTTLPIALSASNAAGGSGSGGGPGSTSPPGTGGGPVASIPLVTMTGIRVVRNKRGRITEVLISFSGAPDPAQAGNTSEYHLTGAGRRGSFAGKGARPIGLRSAGYSPSSDTVSLLLKRPFAPKRPVGVAVDFVRGPLAVLRSRSPRTVSSVV